MARASINRDRRAKLWDAFRIFDADGNGLITAADLERVVLDLDEKIDPRKARAIIAEVYRDGPDAISFEDFQALMASEPGDREVRLRQAFDALDTHHKGQIEFADLEPVMVRFGIGFDELKAMFQIVDTDGDGSISFAEFSELMPADSDQETARSDVHEFEHFDRRTVRPGIASDDRKASTRTRPERNADESPVEASGTSLLQLQIGIFRLIQGAAYRCFRESFSENYETHLRVRNLPYRISDFVEFTELTLTLYKRLGVVDPACEP
ncbi:MAG: histidine kinase, partial [Myxococcales bacterium]|nr:histidine kinase [Myxococcales bacterium]